MKKNLFILLVAVMTLSIMPFTSVISHSSAAEGESSIGITEGKGSVHARSMDDYVTTINPHDDGNKRGQWFYFASPTNRPETTRPNSSDLLGFDGTQYDASPKSPSLTKPAVNAKSMMPASSSDGRPYVVKRYKVGYVTLGGITVTLKGHFKRISNLSSGAEVSIIVDGSKYFNKTINAMNGNAKFSLPVKIHSHSTIDFIVGGDVVELDVSIQETTIASYLFGNSSNDYSEAENPHMSANNFGTWSYHASDRSNPRETNANIRALQWDGVRYDTNASNNSEQKPSIHNKAMNPQGGGSFVVRTFTSNKAGYVRIIGFYNKSISGSSPVQVYVYTDGERKFDATIPATGGKHYFDVPVAISTGSHIDFVVGASSGDAGLQTELEATVEFDSFSYIADAALDYKIQNWSEGATQGSWQTGLSGYDPDGHGSGYWQYLASSQPKLSDPVVKTKELAWFTTKFGIEKSTSDGSILAPSIYKSGKYLYLEPNISGELKYIVQRWNAGISATVNISGFFHHANAAGDGVEVFVYHNGNQIASKDNLKNAKYDFDITRDVSSGDTLDFVVGGKSEGGQDNTRLNARIDVGNARYLGWMTPFWRSSWHDPSLFVRVPNYLYDDTIDFKFPKRPYTNEQAFVDHGSVIRALTNGNASTSAGDIVRRGPDGKIQFNLANLDRLKGTLDSAINNGTDNLIIVLDNVPEAFVAKPVYEHFGQSVPPDHPAEWNQFIKDFCLKLKEYYPQFSNSFHFRVGTELNWKARFNGDTNRLKVHFEGTAAAIRSVFPNANIEPFNVLGPFNVHIDFTTPERDKMNQILNFMKNTEGVDMYSMPVSYYRFADSLINRFPSEANHARLVDWAWDGYVRARGNNPGDYQGIIRSVHEYDTAHDINDGAWTAKTLIDFKRIGVHQAWTKEYLAKVERVSSDKYFFNPNGWLHIAMHRMIGGETYSLPMKQTSINDTYYDALLSVKSEEKETVLMMSAYNDMSYMNSKETVKVKFPRDLISHLGADPKIQFTKMTKENNVYDVLWEDMKAAGNLNKCLLNEQERIISRDINRTADCVITQDKISPAFPGEIVRRLPSHVLMGNTETAASEFVVSQWNKYKGIMIDSLKLKDAPAHFAVNEVGESLEISLDMEAQSVYMIVLSPKETVVKETVVQEAEKFKNKSKVVELRIGNPLMKVDGREEFIYEETPTVTPIIMNNRTLMPARKLVEVYGGNVTWDAGLKRMRITMGSKTIEMTIDSDTIQVNGVNQKIDQPPIIVGGRILVPIRFVIENLDLEVSWSPGSIITIRREQ